MCIRDRTQTMTANTRENLEQRVTRDQSNAEAALRCSQEELGRFRAPGPVVGGIKGPNTFARARQDFAQMRLSALEAIMADPFQAMAEVYVSYLKDGSTVEEEQLWYANVDSRVNEVFVDGSSRIAVLSWTHPGVQLALSSDLGDERDVRALSLIHI